MSSANKNFKWMSLEDVLIAVPRMETQGVSEVARGKKKSSQSKEGFIQAYIATDGDPKKMMERKTGWSDQTWAERRQTFIRRHLRQMRQNDTHSSGWVDGQPTRRHLGLIAWAYTPSPQKTAKWLQSQPKLSTNKWESGVKLPKKNPSNSKLIVPMHRLSKDGVHEKVGKVEISETDLGLKFDVYIKGINVGEHGFHVHEFPNIEPALKEGKMTAGFAAGMHFDPFRTDKHLGPYRNGHLGDLPFLTANREGIIEQSVFAPRLSTISEIKGRSLIIHSHGDNYSDYPLPNGGGKSRMVGGIVTEKCPYCVKKNPRKNKMAAGYQSYAWTTQDWRSIFLHNDGSVSYDKKCGAEGTRLPSGKPRLCLPVAVIEKLLKSKKGTEILREQARKKQRAKKGQRIPWHPEIKKLHSELEAKTVKDDPTKKKKRRNPSSPVVVSAELIPIHQMVDKRWFASSNHHDFYYHCNRSEVPEEISSNLINTVDDCLVELVQFFSERGIQTGASCQGHAESSEDIQRRYIAAKDDEAKIRTSGLEIEDLETGEKFFWKDENYKSPFSSLHDAVTKLRQSKVTGSMTIFLASDDLDVFKQLVEPLEKLGFRLRQTGALDDGRKEITISTSSKSEAIQCDKWSRLLDLFKNYLA